jgi:hypothetical protein
MITLDILEAQAAIELPSRELMATWNSWNINIAVPIIIQNNISIQVCGIGYANTATCSSTQWNVGTIGINW